MNFTEQLYDEHGDDLRTWLKRDYNDELSKLCERYPREKRSVVIDWMDLYTFDIDLAEDARDNADVVKEVLRRCVVDATPQQALVDRRDGGPNNDQIVRGEQVEIRFGNVGDPMDVTTLVRGDHIGSLVTLRGKCTKTSDTRPKPTQAALRCQNCGVITHVHQPVYETNEPGSCSSCESSRSGWEPELSESDWEYHQLARIKHEPGETDSDSHIDVYILGDEAGVLNGGESVDVTGELIDVWPDGIESSTPEFVLIADHVRKHQNDFESIDVATHADRVKELASGEEGDPYELLKQSMAPGIHGGETMDRIKLALACQLFGAPRVENADGTSFRGDIHQLLVGGPGTGKSSLQDAVAKYSPKVSRISGKNATKAGITAAAVRDDFGDTEWSIDAGAFVQANKGICIVDELDKVDGDAVSSLHSALERQQLSVAKAGISADLQCQTALLGAANPTHERFIETEKTIEQVPVGSAMRSRLDTVFVLRDTVDAESDAAKVATMLNTIASGDDVETRNFDDDEAIEAPLNHEEIQAWVAYARQHHTVAFDMALLRERITEYYTDIRQQSADTGAPVNIRKVGSILRFAIASARIRLGEAVTDADIDRAINIVATSLAQIGMTEDGRLSMDSEVAERVTQAERKKRVLTILEDADEALTTGQVADRVGIDDHDAEEELEQLATQGEVVRPRTGEYRPT